MTGKTVSHYLIVEKLGNGAGEGLDTRTYLFLVCCDDQLDSRAQ